MQIEVDKLLPTPLKEKYASRPSDIWNQSLTFHAGQWIKINAPSGTGKTTFIHLLYQLRHDYEGKIALDNKDLSEIDSGALAILRQQSISIIFQDLRLFPNLTAKENIELKRVLQTPYYPAEMIETFAKRLGIESILHQPARICSYGEQQRIAIVRALMQPFEWLLMDEPFSHLDNKNTTIAAELIAEECTKRKAGFILTDLDEDNHFNYTHIYHL